MNTADGMDKREIKRRIGFAKSAFSNKSKLFTLGKDALKRITGV